MSQDINYGEYSGPKPDTNGSILGILLNRNSDEEGISAAVIGADGTDQDTPGESKPFGGFFTSLLIWGMSLGSKTITTETFHQIAKFQTFISCYNDSELIVSLPPNPIIGRLIFIRRNNSAPVIIDGNGKKILDLVPVDTKGMGRSGGEGELAFLLWDGRNWTFNRARV